MASSPLIDLQGERPAFARVVLKLSGESLQGPQGSGIHAETVARIAARAEGSERHGRADGHHGRRREYFSRHAAEIAGHRPRHGRLHGHAGDGDQWSGAAGRARKTGRAHAPAERHRNAAGRRAVHSPPRHAPFGKGPRGDFCGRHRQSLFFHGYGCGACAPWKSRRR